MWTIERQPPWTESGAGRVIAADGVSSDITGIGNAIANISVIQLEYTSMCFLKRQYRAPCGIIFSARSLVYLTVNTERA